jgi:hypothetical protein
LYLDGRVVADSSKESHDEKKQAMLWEESLKFAGVKEGDTTLEDWS